MLCRVQGLGKTLQTISLLAYLHEYRGIKGPHIVIVPKSTLGNWMNEFRRFCPVIRTIKFHGDAASRVSWLRYGMLGILPMSCSPPSQTPGSGCCVCLLGGLLCWHHMEC
jgi:hypothetical protein